MQSAVLAMKKADWFDPTVTRADGKKYGQYLGLVY